MREAIDEARRPVRPRSNVVRADTLTIASRVLQRAPYTGMESALHLLVRRGPGPAFRSIECLMTQSCILSLDAADLDFVDQAAGILMDLLRCGKDEAVALLRAQSLAADTGIDVVARAFVVAA